MTLKTFQIIACTFIFTVVLVSVGFSAGRVKGHNDCIIPYEDLVYVQ